MPLLWLVPKSKKLTVDFKEQFFKFCTDRSVVVLFGKFASYTNVSPRMNRSAINCYHLSSSPPHPVFLSCSWSDTTTSWYCTALRNMMAYLQCTPPPPPLYDLFPKQCRSSLDCFPNLCCQERNRRVCRPPRKSVLALLAMVGQVSQPSFTHIA